MKKDSVFARLLHAAQGMELTRLKQFDELLEELNVDELDHIVHVMEYIVKQAVKELNNKANTKDSENHEMVQPKMCDTCYGNEVVSKFWKNDKTKSVDSDWLYCKECHPNSHGYWKNHDSDDWVEIDIKEFNRLNEELKYQDLSH